MRDYEDADSAACAALERDGARDDLSFMELHYGALGDKAPAGTTATKGVRMEPRPQTPLPPREHRPQAPPAGKDYRSIPSKYLVKPSKYLVNTQ